MRQVYLVDLVTKNGSRKELLEALSNFLKNGDYVTPVGFIAGNTYLTVYDPVITRSRSGFYKHRGVIHIQNNKIIEVKFKALDEDEKWVQVGKN